jgi:hypothetical protein
MKAVQNVEYDVIQFNGSNHNEIINLCGIINKSTLSIGDWVCMDSIGNLCYFSDEAFKNSFTLLEPEEQPTFDSYYFQCKI